MNRSITVSLPGVLWYLTQHCAQYLTYYQRWAALYFDTFIWETIFNISKQIIRGGQRYFDTFIWRTKSKMSYILSEVGSAT